MTLKEHIDDIRKRLEQNIFKSETAVRQGIVDPLFRSLGWPTDDTLVVFPEYPVGSGHVDYALCHPSSTPRVFIEAKQVGNIKGAEEQLFGYDSRIRVPIAVLTDGQEWQFFHPTGEGTWAERKVCELDIVTGDSGENAEKLNRYLNYESIRTGEAVEAIKADYEEVVQQRQIEVRLPEVWNELVQEKNDYLLLAVMEKSKNKMGYEPTEEQVLDFLKNLERKTEGGVERNLSELNPPEQLSRTQSRMPQTFRRSQETKSRQTRLRVIMSNGKVIEHHNATDTWLETILALGPDKVIEVDNDGQIISTSPKFRKDRPEVRHDQYYIAKDYSTKDKKRLLEKIASRLGVQLTIEIVEKS